MYVYTCLLQDAKAKREANMKDGERPAWVDQDMTGKPIEEVIEYEVSQ